MRFTASCGPSFPHGPGQTRAPSLTPISQGAACIAVWPARKSGSGPAWGGEESVVYGLGL